MTNEPAERLLIALKPHPLLVAELRAALVAERKATVERLTLFLTERGYGKAAQTILDAEAQP